MGTLGASIESEEERQVKKGPFVIGAALALAAGLMVVPDAACAQRSRGAVVSGAVVGGGGGRAFAGGGGRAVVTQPGS